MIPLNLPKDAVVLLHPRLAASVEPFDTRQQVRVTIAPVRRRGAVPLRALAVALAFAGGFAAHDVARYVLSGASADEAAALRRELEAPPPAPMPRRAPDLGAAPAPPRPPSTVVRPEDRPPARPDADPFGLTK